MSESCLVKKFRYYGTVSEQEAELLDDLQKDEKSFESGEVILSEGDAADQVHVVSSGLIIVARVGLGGERQIFDGRFSGDFVGLPYVGLERSPASIEALTEAVVCSFPKQRLSEIFEASPHLTGLFFSIAMREEAMLLERFVCLGRRSAYERLAHFIVETVERMRVIGQRGDDGEIDWPFTQAVLGDILGLSEVHVNRTLRRLRQEGHIELGPNRLRVHDEERLREVAEFDPKYLGIDTSWFSDEIPV